MNQPFRLESGGIIDRTQPVEFTFNGRALQGFRGDTLASALLANGERIISRSYKFHRPRGIVSAGAEESNGIVAVDYGRGMLPIVRSTQMPLLDGLVAEAQNCFPSARFDLFRVIDYSRSLWPAGFYNKVFKWPNWHTYEGMIRRLAGIGKLPAGDDPTSYAQMNAHCDVLVVGAGPSGLTAALAAAEDGRDVILVEQDTVPGGSLLHDNAAIDGTSPVEWLSRSRAIIQAHDNVQILTSATAAGYYDSNVIAVHDRSASWRAKDAIEVLWKIRAEEVVLATGAIEQPLMFGNNDLPGVMLAGAMQQYARRYGVKCGNRIVGVVNNDLGWKACLDLVDAGVEVVAVCDIRKDLAAGLADQAGQHGIEVYSGCVPVTARGSGSVRQFTFEDSGGSRQSVRCDALAMSGGLNPTVHLYSQAGGRLRYDTDLDCFVPQECRQQVCVVGAASGDFADASQYDIAPRKLSPASSASQWVDFLHDVTASDIELAVRENVHSVEHVKRYTTTGMAVDQGKTSNLNALSLLGELTGRPPGEVGTTTFRPMYTPVTMGAIAGLRHGDFYHPARHMPAHDWHADHGAFFEDYGGWYRPAYYGDDRDACIKRETLMVRESGGIFDGSPLGKIEVKGPDAAEFLNRIYVNTVPTLRTGRIRYGLMLDENGIIIDDGVFVRIAEDHFLVNSTSAGADRIAGWLEEWHQCEWPELELVIQPVTTQWGVVTVAGPRSRDVLTELEGSVDLSTENLPHMSFSCGEFSDGTPFRVQRVSFTGEQSYELSVPATVATAYFEKVRTIGESHGVGLFGAECLDVLRLEKGYLHVGGDTDGTTNPLDVGFAGIVANKKSDFVGARSLRRDEDRRTDRRQLIGFECGPGVTSHAGAAIVAGSGGKQRTEGFATSACLSPTLGKTIGLALLENGYERKGDTITFYDNGNLATATVTDTCFFDPDGERMRA